MLIACWSVKGGSGTTVVAAALALLLGRSVSEGAVSEGAVSEGVVLVDLAGDIPSVLGLAEPSGPGLIEWLAAGPEVASDALSRLVLPAGAGGGTSLRLLAAGGGRSPSGTYSGDRPDADTWAVSRAPSAGAGQRLSAALARLPASSVVVDCGSVIGSHRVGDLSRGRDDLATEVAGSAGLSLLVLRPCYLALRRALAAPIRPSGVVLIEEPGRALRADDVESVLGVPVRATIPWDPAVARAVDAGLLATRLPRPLARALEAAA